MKKIELLAPAGNLKTLKFALDYGADAVYIGGKFFGARAYAANFEEDELKEAVEYAHLRDRKVYVTVNTIVFNKEVELLLKYIDYLYQLNVDAIIVQDFGVVKLLKDFYPELDIHASTQMTLSNLESIKAAYEMGIKRVVMPRELSLKEIKKIKSATGIEVEAFVHGALCVSYSGQCLFSSVIGGRSGNRGRCAGPCRLKYDLLDDRMNTIASNMHLLSMADLCTIDYIKDMIESGIDSFKIEGRMKEKEYVASVVMSYRKAIDAYLSGEKINTDMYKEMMSGIFTRGFSNGYLYEKKPQYMSYTNPKNKGVPLGKVISIDGKKIKVSLLRSLSLGDGISTETGEYGYKVDDIMVEGKKVDEAYKGQVVELKKIPVNCGDALYKTYDAKLNKLFSVSNELKSPVDVFVNMREDKPLNIMIRNNDIFVSKDSKIASVKAMKKAIDKDTLIEKVSSINDTPFYVNDIEVDMDEGLFMPLSEVKETRRKAVEDLIAKKLKYREPKNIHINFHKSINDKIGDLKLSLYTEREEHVKIAYELGVDRVYFNYRLNYDAIKDVICYRDKCEVVPAFPQIMRDELDDFQREMENIKEMGFKKVLVTNLGMYDAAIKLGLDVCVDFNLNVSNNLAADFFDKADTITLSPELNIHQIEDISSRSNAKFEAIAYGRLPLLTMEYCPIKNLKGCDKKGCEEGKYFLKDRKGNLMKIVSDGFCRIKVLNSSVLYMADKMNDSRKIGLSYIRINDTVESDEEIKDAIKEYKNSLKFGTCDLHVKNYTRGHFYRGVL
ncbi:MULTISPECIES: U32 family peptidase [Thermoanaerobacterium]|uniref:Peptidase U32 n=2 Tax=Thermoanaerobacterium TaxID=28895 RepID=W9EAB3_9THEO|nr:MULTISPECIES: U32 family peptidase [Thermoanaerobacterium]AFK87197.1 peptidase U32 [Thermoanaerobacterium saccharolyticum JW/SL-YS485]ETO38081.1 peptidase U32 [Thermoanaerobacterium aotearoense SCUT27]